MEHLFPAPDMKRESHAHAETRAWETLTQAAWSARIQGNNCHHLVHLCMRETGVLASSGCARLTSPSQQLPGVLLHKAVPEQGDSEAEVSLALRPSAVSTCKREQSDMFGKSRLGADGQQDSRGSLFPGSKVMSPTFCPKVDMINQARTQKTSQLHHGEFWCSFVFISVAL